MKKKQHQLCWCYYFSILLKIFVPLLSLYQTFFEPFVGKSGKTGCSPVSKKKESIFCIINGYQFLFIVFMQHFKNDCGQLYLILLTNKSCNLFIRKTTRENKKF